MAEEANAISNNEPETETTSVNPDLEGEQRQEEDEDSESGREPEQKTGPEEKAKEEEPKPSAKKKYRVKIDDEEAEIDEDELVRGYQKGKAGDKRLREAAQMQKQINAFLTELKSGDHKNIVKLLGKEQAKKMAESLLLEEIEYEDLPEHEKTIRQLQQEKEELLSKQKQEEEYKKKLERKKLEDQAAHELQEDVMSAIKESQIKPNKLVMRGMIDIMRAYHTQTQKKLPAREAIEYVNGVLPKEIAEYISALPSPKRLEFKKLLSKDVLTAFRQDDVNSVLSQDIYGTAVEKTSTQKPTRNRKEKMRVSTDDWFNKMEKRLGG